jgi:hypothetical protein
LLFPERQVAIVSEESHGHAHASASAGQLPFSPEECAALHEEDKRAATHVVMLMLGVFTIGVIMYLYIALVI